MDWLAAIMFAVAKPNTQASLRDGRARKKTVHGLDEFRGSLRHPSVAASPRSRVYCRPGVFRQLRANDVGQGLPQLGAKLGQIVNGVDGVKCAEHR